MGSILNIACSNLTLLHFNSKKYVGSIKFFYADAKGPVNGNAFFIGFPMELPRGSLGGSLKGDFHYT